MAWHCVRQCALLTVLQRTQLARCQNATAAVHYFGPFVLEHASGHMMITLPAFHRDAAALFVLL